jgi:hypothetical protein
MDGTENTTRSSDEGSCLMAFLNLSCFLAVDKQRAHEAVSVLEMLGNLNYCTAELQDPRTAR